MSDAAGPRRRRNSGSIRQVSGSARGQGRRSTTATVVPRTDADNDGIPDTQDACPKEPGKPNSDPKKNGCPTFIKVEGNVVRIMQQVHFATGSAVILPESFPMLQEIADLLRKRTKRSSG